LDDNRHFNSICDLFTWAKKWDWIESNPTAELDPLEENPTKRKPWPSNEHIQIAIDSAKAWAKKPFFFIAQTGVRSVGAKKLQWPHVNFEERRFMIQSRKGRNGALREHWIPMTDSVYEFSFVSCGRIEQWANTDNMYSIQRKV